MSASAFEEVLLLPYAAMDATRALEIAKRTIQLVGRCFSGAILCFFAFVPGWILFHGLADVLRNPRNVLDASLKDLLMGLGVLAFCAALMYFLLLLAYRASLIGLPSFYQSRKKERRRTASAFCDADLRGTFCSGRCRSQCLGN